jgi:hypothetical protein
MWLMLLKDSSVMACVQGVSAWQSHFEQIEKVEQLCRGLNLGMGMPIFNI